MNNKRFQVEINESKNGILGLFLNIGKKMQGKSLTPTKSGRGKSGELKIKEINNYIQNRVMPVLAPLQLELLIKQPPNIKEYCIEWLKRFNHTVNDDPKELFSDEESDEVFQERRRRRLNGKRRVRKGVSGDSTQSFNVLLNSTERRKDANWPEQTKINLLLYLKKCIFFEHLTHDSLLKLIAKVRLRAVEEGEVVLREGDIGDILYIVEDGRFKCEKRGSTDILKEYKAGEFFGELALLYNHPRASTITAITAGRLFELDRQEFNLILRTKMIQKINECEAFVDKIEFFKDLDIYERTKLFESLEERRLPAEKYIIKEGEMGNCFYIVAEGQLVAYKVVDGQNRMVYAYKKGDYFGEIALLKNVPRQASIKTLTEIIGPLEGILSRSCQRYAIWGGELSGEGEF